MIIALDTEVPGLARDLKPFMITACDETGSTMCWEQSVNPRTRSVEWDRSTIKAIIDYCIGNEIVFQHGQFDILKFANIGIQFSLEDWSTPSEKDGPGTWFVPVKAIHELMLMSHLVDSRGVYNIKGNEAKSSHGLKEQALCRLSVTDSDEIKLRKAVQSARLKAKKLGWSIGESTGEDYWLPREIWREYNVVKNYGSIPNEAKKIFGEVPDSWEHLCRDYALHDVRERTMSLFLLFREVLQDDGRWEMYENERPLIPIYYMMERAGLRTDRKHRKKISDDFTEKADKHHEACKRLAKKGTEFNINSDPQLRKLLIDDWKLTTSHRTPKKGEASVNAKSLESIRDYLAFSFPEKPPKQWTREESNNLKAYNFLCHLIGEKDYEQSTDTRSVIKSLGYRQYIKALSYLDFYSREAVDDTFHATIFPTGTATTRISTEGSQNIGKKIIDGVSLRSAFGPPPGRIWVSIDYEQLELRIFAALSGDKALIRAFEEGYDFHEFVAMKIFGLPTDQITSEQRRIAKNTNFAMIFGGSPWKVDYTAGMKGAYDAFSKQFPSAKAFMDENIAYAKEHGYVETVDGYPLYVPANEPYKGTDYRVQGTAGRIIKRAMNWLMYGRSQSQYSRIEPIVDWRDIIMRVQIHDELVFEIDTNNRPRKNTVRLINQISTIMEEAGQSYGIATPVDAKIHVDNWGEKMSIRQYAVAA